MKKLLFTLTLALVLITSCEVFANSSKFGLLSNNTQNLNSLRFFYTQNQSAVDTGSSKSLKNTNLKLKTPKDALFYAIVPGSVVHGAGHFYAGETKTGIALLAAEAVGIGFYFAGISEGLIETTGGEEHSGAYFATALVLFMGSWGFDILRAPQIVMKQNQELEKKQRLNLRLERDSYCIKLKIVRTF